MMVLLATWLAYFTSLVSLYSAQIVDAFHPREIVIPRKVSILSSSCPRGRRSPAMFLSSSYLDGLQRQQTAAASSGSSAPPSRERDFWRKERSPIEVELHIQDCLAQVPCSTKPQVIVISNEPPLVVIHDFIPKQGCDDIIQAAKDSGCMQRSTTGSEQDESTSRTSSTVWLEDDQCPGPLRLLAEKVSRISGLPTSFMENLQVCRYEPGQQFQLHTDHQDSFNDLECRGRLATCLIYLAEPAQGGATWFPGVGDTETTEGTEIFVPARQGSAVFFWNTMEKPGSTNYSPDMFLNTDFRLRHAGLPVTVGEKWICNRWIHPIDFGSGVVGM